MDDTQLLKGILEGCVLAIIAKGETYGYEILTAMAQVGFDNLSEGTLYPVLTRLNKSGFISCRKAASPLGPIRKYYTVTTDGMTRLNNFKTAYRKIADCAEKVLFDDTL